MQQVSRKFIRKWWHWNADGYSSSLWRQWILPENIHTAVLNLFWKPGTPKAWWEWVDKVYVVMIYSQSTLIGQKPGKLAELSSLLRWLFLRPGYEPLPEFFFWWEGGYSLHVSRTQANLISCLWIGNGLENDQGFAPGVNVGMNDDMQWTGIMPSVPGISSMSMVTQNRIKWLLDAQWFLNYCLLSWI